MAYAVFVLVEFDEASYSPFVSIVFVAPRCGAVASVALVAASRLRPYGLIVVRAGALHYSRRYHGNVTETPKVCG